MDIIQQIKKEISVHFNDIFQITEETGTTLKFHQKERDQWSKFEFEIELGTDKFYAKEVFDNPADWWEIEYSNEEKFLERLIDLR